MFCASNHVAREFSGLWLLVPILVCELLCLWSFDVSLTSYALSGSLLLLKSGLGSLSCLVKCILTLSMERR